MKDRALRFITAEEDGQAALLVLNLLVPMVLAVGLMMRVDNMVTQKIRLQNAVDAAALEVGALTARTMNQIAIHNQLIVKRLALVAAVRAARRGAQDALQQAEQELERATRIQGCWQRHAGQAQADQANPEPPTGSDDDDGKYSSSAGGPNCDDEAKAAQQTQQCAQFLQQEIIPNWQDIVQFWRNEDRWLEGREGVFTRELADITRSLANKSETMVDDLARVDSQGGVDPPGIREILDRLQNVHRVEELFLSAQPAGDWLSEGPMQAVPRMFVKARPSDYESIGFTGLDDTNGFSAVDNQVKGFKHFEGTPAFHGNSYSQAGPVAESDDKSSTTGQQDGEWGPSRYYLEFIKNVHFGTPGYFDMEEHHGPRGNPDSQDRQCGQGDGEEHPGCDEERKAGGNPCPDQELSCSYCSESRVNTCIDDVEDYTRDTAIDSAENAIQGENLKAFNEGDETMYRLASPPRLEWVVGGRMKANRSRPQSGRSARKNAQFASNPGYFASLLPANTIADSPTGRVERSNYDDETVNALSRFRLYNLTESERQVLPEPDDFDDYPKALLTQDWNVLLVPLRRNSDSPGRSGAVREELQNAGGLKDWTKKAMLH